MSKPKEGKSQESHLRQDPKRGKSSANLGRLLQRSWEPPEPREAFRGELLAKLKEKQGEVVRQRAARRRVIRLFTATASIAAAVALIFSNQVPSPNSHPDRLQLQPQPNVVSQAGAIAMTEDSAVISKPKPEAITKVPNSAAVATAPRTNEKIVEIAANVPSSAPEDPMLEFVTEPVRSSRNISSEVRNVSSTTLPRTRRSSSLSLTSLFGTHRVKYQRKRAGANIPGIDFSSLPAGEGVPVLVRQNLEYRAPGTKQWRLVKDGERFRIADGSEVRTPQKNKLPIGLNMSSSAGIILSPGTRLRNEKGVMVLDDGVAIALVGPGQKPISVRVDDYNVKVQPRSVLLFATVTDSRFTADGAPAPIVLVFRGTATTTCKRGTGTLVAGQAYQMYRYLKPQVPGRNFSLGEKHMASGMSRMPWNMAGFAPQH